MWESLESRLTRVRELDQLLADPKVLADRQQFQKLAKERAALSGLATLAERYKGLEQQVKDADHIVADPKADSELKAMAQGELSKLRETLQTLHAQLEEMLLTDDPDADRNVVMEIRAGTGGLEASLFASDLYRMYGRYAAGHDWKVEALSKSMTEAGGFKEVIFFISGSEVFRKLKFERGVHRVQRVPVTEAGGRIHTSTVTVAVLPEAEEVDIAIDPKDLKIDVFRSSGPGGQSVNTTDSAVRITHLPSGLVVSCQDERSQLKNKMKGMKILRARLLDHAREESAKQQASDRRSQIGTGERSEKIRTYNFPDRRVTDHRIGLTTHRLTEVLDGSLDELVEALMKADREVRLKNAK